MRLFEFLLLLVAAVLVSNILNRFFPLISVPIIQIILGVFVALLPIGGNYVLEPNLFFVVFLAPLVFYSGMITDKKALWELKNPVLNMSVFLVIATVMFMGYIVHWAIPIIPLSASFVLIAAMAPTDVVAVASVGERVKIPPKVMGILSGESTINDASGLVCFQFAVSAMMTSSFSVVNATVNFLFVAIGGVALGLLFALAKNLFVRWLRLLGMENVILHVLIGLLAPFVLYIMANFYGVSGVLAVFTAGLAHSLGKKQLNPETVSLNVLSKNIWEVLSFTLDGLVFVILGTQLPAIIRTIGTDSVPISVFDLLLYIVFINLIFVISRFLWSYFTIPRKYYEDQEHKISKFMACVIFSLSGARGAVTMASALSIPFMITNNTVFAQRDLIILISTGVILLSLILTNFILPILVRDKNEEGMDEEENEAHLEILHNVIRQLNKLKTEENRSAAEYIIGNYYRRSAKVRKRQTSLSGYLDARKLSLEAFEWQRENTNTLLEQGKTDPDTARRYLGILEAQSKKNRINLSRIMLYLRISAFRIFHLRHFKKLDARHGFKELSALREANCAFVITKLRELDRQGGGPAVNKLISVYELALSVQKVRGMDIQNDSYDTHVDDIAAIAFQLERDNIQHMYENGRISLHTANEMRKNISLSEMQL